MKTTRRNFIKGAAVFVAGLGFLKIPEIPKGVLPENEKYGRSIGLEAFNDNKHGIDTAFIKQFQKNLLLISKQKRSRIKLNYG